MATLSKRASRFIATKPHHHAIAPDRRRFESLIDWVFDSIAAMDDTSAQITSGRRAIALMREALALLDASDGNLAACHLSFAIDLAEQDRHADDPPSDQTMRE